MQGDFFLSHIMCDYISTYINTSNYSFVLKRTSVIIRNNRIMNDLTQRQKIHSRLISFSNDDSFIHS